MKKILCLVLALVMVLGMVACGASEPAPTDAPKAEAPAPAPAAPAEEKPAEPVKLTISMWGDEARVAGYMESLKPFCEANNVEVEITAIPLADYYTKLSSNLAAGTAPDVFWVAANNEATYITNGYTLDLRPTLEAYPGWDMDDWYEGALEKTDYIGDGGIYGVPLSFGVRGVFYNKTLFEAAGVKTPAECVADGTWTYETMFDLGEQIRKFDDTKIGVKLWCNGQANTYNVGFADILLAYGTNFVNDDSSEFILDSDAGKKVIQMIYDEMFVTESHAKPGDETAFLSGNVAMARETYSYMTNVVKAEVDFEWDVVPLPYGDAGSDSYLYTGNAYWHANADGKNPELAKQLIAFISTKEAQLEWCKTFMVPRKSIMSSEKMINLGEGFPAPENIKAAFADSIEERPLWAYTGTEQWTLATTAIQQGLENIWAGAYNVEDGIAAMKSAVEPFLN